MKPRVCHNASVCETLRAPGGLCFLANLTHNYRKAGRLFVRQAQWTLLNRPELQINPSSGSTGGWMTPLYSRLVLGKNVTPSAFDQASLHVPDLNPDPPTCCSTSHPSCIYCHQWLCPVDPLLSCEHRKQKLMNLMNLISQTQTHSARPTILSSSCACIHKRPRP